MAIPNPSTNRRALQFTIAETMILAAAVGAVLRWPAMIWIAIPLAAFWSLRRMAVTQRLRWWLPALGLYLMLIPFTFAPLNKIEDRWVTSGYLGPKYYTLAMYRPVMRVVKYTPLYQPVWKWTLSFQEGRLTWEAAGWPPPK